MNLKLTPLFSLLIAIQFLATEKFKALPECNLEIVLLQKFTGKSAPGAKKYAFSIYTLLQQCLQEKKEMACVSGFKLFNRMKSVIKERNIAMTKEEQALFEQMEKKYTAGVK